MLYCVTYHEEDSNKMVFFSDEKEAYYYRDYIRGDYDPNCSLIDIRDGEEVLIEKFRTRRDILRKILEDTSLELSSLEQELEIMNLG